MPGCSVRSTPTEMSAPVDGFFRFDNERVLPQFA
jgi:hypothetical protein